MSENTPKATEWHRKPRDFNGPCPICGCNKKFLEEHRAVDKSEGFDALWINRRTSNGGYIETVIGSRSAGPETVNILNELGLTTSRESRHHHGPTRRVSKLIDKVTALLAQGKTLKEASKEIGASVPEVRDWKFRHGDLWNLANDRATKILAELVRQMAGSEHIMDDPDNYVRMAARVDAAMKRRGEELFPPGPEMSLTKFYTTHYLPNCLFDAALETKRDYCLALGRWRLITGDPPLSSITSELLARFRDVLMAMPGKREGSRMSPNSVRSRMRAIHTLLNKAGPPAPHNRDALGIIDRAPWARPPRPRIDIPRTVSQQPLNDVYAAAVCMDLPRIPGFKPPAWWRAMVVLAYNTGLRRKTLFQLRMDEIDWQGCRLVIHSKQMKSRRPQVIHLNATALEHLRAIRTDRELVFPWPFNIRHFHTCFHRLQLEAGIPQDDHFGLHNLRKTTATLLAQESVSAAQFALGHTSSAVTEKHYINAGEAGSAALDRMAQPQAFRTGTGRDNGIAT